MYPSVGVPRPGSHGPSTENGFNGLWWSRTTVERAVPIKPIEILQSWYGTPPPLRTRSWMSEASLKAGSRDTEGWGYGKHECGVIAVRTTGIEGDYEWMGMYMKMPAGRRREEMAMDWSAGSSESWRWRGGEERVWQIGWSTRWRWSRWS